MTDARETEPNKMSGRARRALLRRLIDFAAMPSSSVTPPDRAMGGDILLDLLFQASDAERQLCASRLAAMREAPRRVLRYLAQCPFEIAQPVLVQNEAFDASDLCQIVAKVATEHRIAIAGRKVVAPVVGDHLCATGDVAAMRRLLNNTGATLSEMSVDMLVARSRKNTDMCALLIRRPELKSAQAMAMFWWADAPTRRIILQRHASERSQMIDFCSDIYAMAAEDGWRDPVVRKSLQLVERRQRNRTALETTPYDSLEHAVETASDEGMTPELAAEIGYLCGIKPVTIGKIFSDLGGEGLAVLCKATGLKRESLGLLWQGLGRPVNLESGEANPAFARVLETYEVLSVAKAQTTLRYWNWSLSSAFSPAQIKANGIGEDDEDDDAGFSASRRTARLVFGK